MGVLLDALDYLRDADSWTGPGGMLELLVQQLLVTLTALLAAMLVGLPVALWLGHLGRGGFLAINISNVGRAVPTFALLAIFVAGDPWGWTAGAFPGTGDVGPYGRAGISALVALALGALGAHPAAQEGGAALQPGQRRPSALRGALCQGIY